ncbi:MAG: RNA polymerase sigma factor [Myxococcota bacterium]
MPSLSMQTDAEVVARAFGGERAAFAMLMQRYNQRLFRVAWSLLKSRAEAEDAVQEAWVVAFQRLDQVEDSSRFGAWLTRVVVNEALRRRRFDLRHQELCEAEEARAMSDNDSPEALAAQRELRPVLELAVAALPDFLRAVFVLREIEGMSVGDVADTLGIPEGTVKTRAFRARELLRERLATWSDSAVQGILQFAGEHCAELTARVLARLDFCDEERH